MEKILPMKPGCPVWEQCFCKSVLPPSVSRWYDRQDRMTAAVMDEVTARLIFPDHCHFDILNGRNVQPSGTLLTHVTEQVSVVSRCLFKEKGRLQGPGSQPHCCMGRREKVRLESRHAHDLCTLDTGAGG